MMRPGVIEVGERIPFHGRMDAGGRVPGRQRYPVAAFERSGHPASTHPASAYTANRLGQIAHVVTVNLVDQARTSRSVRGEAVRQTRARLALAEAEWASAVARQNEAQAAYAQSDAQLDQSMKSIPLLEPLVAQRQARDAAVKNAAYDLERCKVYAPFDARVTNLTISEGAYAHMGQQAFTLIDARTWWVIANFRETELRRIQSGMKADVYVMSRPDQKFEGTIDSVGFGVTPDVSLVGGLSQGLPDVQRSLNWVHLATRFPVRIRVNSPSPGDFRIGASAMVVMRGR